MGRPSQALPYSCLHPGTRLIKLLEVSSLFVQFVVVASCVDWNAKHAVLLQFDENCGVYTIPLTQQSHGGKETKTRFSVISIVTKL